MNCFAFHDCVIKPKIAKTNKQTHKLYISTRQRSAKSASTHVSFCFCYSGFQEKGNSPSMVP